MAYTLYSSTDTSAPVLDGLATSFIDVIRACLVDGYGSKTAAGWSIVMDDGLATKLVLTNNAGYGSKWSFLDDNSLVSQVRMRMFEAVTDYDTGTNPSGYAHIRKSSTASTTARPWVVIADDRFCFFLNTPAYTTYTDDYTYMHFFGDAIPLSAGDTHFAVLGGALTAGYYSQLPYIRAVTTTTGAANSYVIHAQRPMAGTGSASMVACVHGMQSLMTLLYVPYYGKKYLFRPMLNDSAAFTLRGFLPGFYSSPGNPGSYTSYNSYTFDGTSYRAFRSYGQVFFFNMDNPR